MRFRTLRKTDFSLPHSFTTDAISRLDQDASDALATIREWKNSLVRINRIPLEILSLIPTYLVSQKDRFYAASVCRHWRKVFLQHGAIWSELFTGKGEVYVKTLLKRVKGSPIDVIVRGDTPAGTAALLPTQQIRRLEFTNSYWEDIIAFSEIGSGSFPLLQILEITSVYDRHGQFISVTPLSLPFFRGAVDMKQFTFHSNRLQLLSRFVFPNLTTFDLLTWPGTGSDVSHLLDFLKASPMLRKVGVKINGRFVPGGIPLEIVVVLPNAESFALSMRTYTRMHVYNIAAHVSCPRAKQTSLMHEIHDIDVAPELEIFPAPTELSKITDQYTTSPNPVEEVTLEIEPALSEAFIKCSLTLRSSNETIVRLGFQVLDTGLKEDELLMSLEEIGCEAFNQAHRTIGNHPPLAHIKRLHVKYPAAIEDSDLVLFMANEVGRLFGSMGPLDSLTIEGCDLRIYLASILDLPEFEDLEQQIVFPPVNELTILHPLMDDIEEECLEAIVELAKSRHALGIQFGRVTLYTEWLPAGMAERLKQWVGEADCYEEVYAEE